LLYPETIEVKAASVATSNLYPVTPVTVVQLAVNPLDVIDVAALAVGIGGIGSINILSISIVPEPCVKTNLRSVSI